MDDEWITSQLAGLAAIEAAINDFDVNVSELFEGIDAAPGFGIVLSVAASTIGAVPEPERSEWIAETRRRILAGKIRIEGMSNDD